MYCTILYAGTLWRIKMLFLKSVFCSWQNWVAATSHPSFCSHTCVASSLSGFSKQSGVWWCVSSGHNVITQSPDFISKKNLLLTWHNKPFHTSNTIDNCSILKIRKLRHRRPEVRCLKHIRGGKEMLSWAQPVPLLTGSAHEPHLLRDAREGISNLCWGICELSYCILMRRALLY